MSDIYETLGEWQAAPKGTQLMKSLRAQEAEPKSAIIDPYNYMSMSAGTRSKPLTVSYDVLRRMAQVPAIAAILLTRKNQVARYARRPRYEGDMGFQIRLKDPKAKMTEAARKEAMRIEDFFLKTGSIKNLKRKDNFNTFLRKIVDDSLTLDTMVWENVPNRKGELSEIWAVDAATIELVANAPVSEIHTLPVYVPDTKAGMRLGGDIAYVQRVNGIITAEYSEEELAFAIRNPRTNMEVTDFGMSELEVLVEIVTGIMNGVRYNTSYFSHSHMPQGVLEIVGKYQDKHLEGFKRHWKTLTSGAAGKWSVPVMALEEGQGFKFTPFKSSNKDMEFNEFLEFLFNIACAVYQIDPNEVGFKSWTSNSGAMGKSDNTEAKMEGSKDKGFVPLMNFVSDTFNSEIVDRMNEDFEFQWVGVDEEDEDERMERDKSALESGLKTVNEVRKARDMEVINAKWADAPANPQLIQVFMAETGLGQPQQEGAPGEEDDPNAELDAQQAQADDAHEKGQEMADDSHEKQLEVMDKQHEQNLEMEKLKHKNTLEQKKVDAKNKPKPAPAAGKAPLKKSLTSEDETVAVTISWEGY